MPRNPFHFGQSGWGAWELAARISYVDLNSNFTPGTALSSNLAAVDGGRQYGYWLGLNWYPTSLVRFMFDFGHVEFERANGAILPGVPLGAPVGATLNSISLRGQVVY
jgi:phosphate-selective porin OprO/OprP